MRGAGSAPPAGLKSTEIPLGNTEPVHRRVLIPAVSAKLSKKLKQR